MASPLKRRKVEGERPSPLKRKRVDEGGELIDNVARLKAKKRALCNKQQQLEREINETKWELRAAERELENFPRVVYYTSTRAPPVLPPEVVDKIMWFYVRIRRNRIMYYDSADLYCLYDKAHSAALCFYNFNDFLLKHDLVKIFRLLAKYSSPHTCKYLDDDPKWRTDPIQARTVKEVADQLKTIVFTRRADARAVNPLIRVTVFSDDGLVSVQCPPEAVHMITRRWNGAVSLAGQIVPVTPTKGGFVVPYCVLPCRCHTPVKICDLCHPRLCVNRISGRAVALMY